MIMRKSRITLCLGVFGFNQGVYRLMEGWTDSLGVMSRKSRSTYLTTIIQDLLAGIVSQDEERRDISCLGQLLPHSHPFNLPIADGTVSIKVDGYGNAH
jgi:hypothetical protein